MIFRSRLMFGFLAVLMLLAMASSSYAQISLQLIPEPSAGEIQTNRNAQTGTTGSSGAGILVSGQSLTGTALTTTTLRIAYPATITSSPVTFPANSFGNGNSVPTTGSDFIRIEGASGMFIGLVTNGSIVLNTDNKRIEITLPGLKASEATGGSFTVVGTRIDANGLTGAQSFTASLNQVANNYILATTSGTVINALGPGIGTMALGSRPGTVVDPNNTNNATATIFTNRSVADSAASFYLTEGFSTAWRTAAQSSNSGGAVKNGTQIRLTFSGIPQGVTLNLTLSGGTTTTNSAPTPAAGVVTASNATFLFTPAPSLTGSDSVEVQVTVNPLSATAAVTTPGSITVVATHFPIGDGVDNSDATKLSTPREDQGYPTFLQADTPAITIVNIVPANTTLLIPLVEKVSVFDTGISIANTTVDPFGAATGGAIASAGTLRFDFFPTTATGAGTPCFLQTSATSRPGFGIASDGTIAAGATYAVLVSQLLAASNCAAGDFVGYIFVTAGFLNAHGQATISDFRTYSLAANVLTLPPPATKSRTNLTLSNNVESLDF